LNRTNFFLFKNMAKYLMIIWFFLACILVIQAYPQDTSSQTSLTDEEKEKLFQKIDKNEDGSISKKELRKHVKAANKEQDNPDENLTNEKINEAFDAIDTDGNKELNMEEFKAAEAKFGNKRAWWLIFIVFG